MKIASIIILHICIFEFDVHDLAKYNNVFTSFELKM